MKKIALVFLLPIIFCRCNQSCPDIAYEGEPQTKTHYDLAAEVLNDSFLFSWPRDIIIIDSLLLVHDSYKQANCFHIFNKYNGAHLKSFGKKGRGPGEFLDVNAVNYNYDGRTVTIFDPNSKKVIMFDIINTLNGSGVGYREKVIMSSPNFVKQLIPYGDKFIAKGNNNKMRYAIWAPLKEQFSNIYTDFPQLSDDEEANWALTDYSVKVRLSPNGQKLVTGTYIGGILEIFDTKDGEFTPAVSRYFFEPKYGYAQGAIPRWVTTIPETKIGFEDIFVKDDVIYGLIWETEKSSMPKHTPSIIQFDYIGNPNCRYTFDTTLEAFAVDNDNTIYGVAYDVTGQYSLNKYTYPN